MVRFKLLGRAWRLLFVSREEIPGLDGECHWQDRTVRVVDSLREFDALETVLHELLHAQDERMPERKVASVAKTMARVLRRLGWRRA